MAKERVRLVIGILSSRQTTHRADAVRLTWLRDVTSPSVRAFFLVGDPGKAPTIDGDILCLDCGDDYEDLVHKVRAFLRFVAQKYPAALVFKCDDDTYVHVPNLLRAASRIETGYAGHVMQPANPKGEERARSWHLEKVKASRFRKFYSGRLEAWCDGGVGYFLAADAWQTLLGMEAWQPNGYVGEDVHTSNLLASVGVFPRPLKGLQPVGEGCLIDQVNAQTISLHPVAADDMLQIHQASCWPSRQMV